MSFEKPSKDFFILQCDACGETIEFTEAEGLDTTDTVACLSAAKKLGWKSDKHVGFSWEHFCPECAKLPDADRRPRAAHDRIRR